MKSKTKKKGREMSETVQIFVMRKKWLIKSDEKWNEREDEETKYLNKNGGWKVKRIRKRVTEMWIGEGEVRGSWV